MIRMSSLDRYKKRLSQTTRGVKEQRRKAADLNNNLAWELADGHQDGLVLTRHEIDNNSDQWEEMDILVRHALTGQEKKIITKPHIEMPIGTYVRYGDKICIIRENLLDKHDVMPSYKAYVCTTELHLKGCPYTFPVYAFNSSYSSVGLADYGKILGLDSRNKLYLQKNKFTIRLYENHRRYRIIVGDEETKYYYFITEMDDISYPGMFVVSLKIDEQHSNDDGFYAFNENPIDFSDLILAQGGDEEKPETGIISPELTCETYQKLNKRFEVLCNKSIKTYELSQGLEVISLNDERHTLVVKPTEKGVKNITIIDSDNRIATKKIVVKE